MKARDPYQIEVPQKKEQKEPEFISKEQQENAKRLLEKMENEKYVLINSNKFRKIYGNTMQEGKDEHIEGLIKIKNKCKTVYRRFKGYPIEGDSVVMGYRTRKELGVEDGDEVSVSKACWFCYLWHNQDSCVKWPFRIAFIGIIFAIISFFLTMLGLIVAVISLILTLVNGGCCC